MKFVQVCPPLSKPRENEDLGGDTRGGKGR